VVKKVFSFSFREISVVMFSIVVQGMTITPMITAAKKACGDA
jgi:NhaP-type Na+/H+ or K+/H+ antiporter